MTGIRITGIAAGGDGVGRLDDGKAVFVPRTAPGDLVAVELTENRSRFARGRVTSILESGPARVDPACPHYTDDHCGGCQLQHLASGEQRAARVRIVGDALRRIGRRDVRDPGITPARDDWRYRTKVTLHAVAGRIGYHRFDRPGTVFDLEECHIARPALMDLWRQVTAARAALPTGLETVTLREDRDGGRHLIVGGGTAGWDAAPLARALPDGVSIWWAPGGGAARVVAGRETGFPALAFAQIHPELADRVRRQAVDALGALQGTTVWDLYGGVGDTARLLAEGGATVVSVDADRSAIAWARARAPEGVTFMADRVEEAVARLPAPDRIVLNPPRAGAHERVARAIARHAVPTAYVSCDPATLARDLQRMPALAIRSVDAFDQFPQTAHVETLVVLDAP